MGETVTVRSIAGHRVRIHGGRAVGVSWQRRILSQQKKVSPNFSALKTLVVVDDDVAVCECGSYTEGDRRHRRNGWGSGRKAIERVQALLWSRQTLRYDSLSTGMPDIDGIETARRIRAIVGPEVTIIIMTAYDWASIEHEARLAGVNLLMSKPMFKTSLVSAF